MAIRRIAQVGLGSRLGGGGSILTTADSAGPCTQGLERCLPIQQRLGPLQPARFAQIGRGQCGGKARLQGLEFQLGGIIWRLPKPLCDP